MSNAEPTGAGPVRTLLNGNHQRVLASSLTHFDNLLVEVETIASGAATRSPFSPYLPDLNPSELRILQDYVTEIRLRMAEMAQALDITAARSGTPTSRAVDVTLLSAEIGLAELEPDKLRGYGSLSEDGEIAVEHFTSDLTRLIRRVRTLLARPEQSDLADRVARLHDAPIDLNALAALERVIRRRGFVPLRDPFAALLERLERRTFEICVFGRVNAGKSTLLNTVLDTDALPVGITPVTAVPTRIVFGAVPEATITLQDGERIQIPLERLPEFVSEERNPDNEKGVTTVCLRLPSRHLAEGIAFVDTPGLGSLATMGSRESYRYLPRCDLGILLIDASNPPTREDVEVLRLLEVSAIATMAVLTKADLLSDTELSRMQTLARAQITQALGRGPDLHVVSTRGAAAVRAHDWFTAAIAPLCTRARTLGEKSMRVRFSRLSIAAVAAARAESGNASTHGNRSKDLEDVGATAERYVRDSRRRCEAIERSLRASLAEAFDAAATVAARRVAEDGDGSVVGESAAMALEVVMTRQLDATLQELLRAQHQLQEVLARFCALVGEGSTPERLAVDLVGRPAPAVPADIRSLRFVPPWWLHLSKRLFRRRIALALHERLDRSASDSVARIASELRTWGDRVLDDLAKQFAMQTDPIRAAQRGRKCPGVLASSTNTRSDRRDLAILEAVISIGVEVHTQPEQDCILSDADAEEPERCSQER